MTMFNNWLSAFDKREPSPLYGKPLIYLTGAKDTPRAIPGNVVEGPAHNRTMADGDDKIAYCNLFHDPDTDWNASIIGQLTRVAGLSFKFAELDNADAYSIGDVQKMTTLAHSYGLGVIAKNPVLTNGPLQFIAHPNVFGVIVERGAGAPATYDYLRSRARKDGLIPVWFVFDGPDGAQQCADQITLGGFKGMGVTYSTDNGVNAYIDSHTVLLPIV